MKLFYFIITGLLISGFSFSQTTTKKANPNQLRTNDIKSITANHVDPLITTDNWRTHMWPYNAYFPLSSDPDHRHGIANGHVCASCGPTSFSRIIHYWEFPVQGTGSFSFTDTYGCTYSTDFGATTYEWDKMPYELNESDSEDTYASVATLMYHVATTVNDVNVTGGDMEMWITGLTTYLNYSSEAHAVNRSDYTREEWIDIYKNELENGRPMLIGGGTPEGGGHWFICDGFNDADEFHFIMGWAGDGDGYYDIDNPNNYSVDNRALIGLQPELNGKELSLQSHNENEIIIADDIAEITWNSTNVTNIKIEYTVDKGYNWVEIISSTPASAGSYSWTTPDISSNDCKIKLTDISDINVYDKSNKAFSIQPYALSILTPQTGSYFIPGSQASISWENTPVANIKIEYSSNNGTEWNEIAAGVDAGLGFYRWTVPNNISGQCIVRITDISDAAVLDISSGNFEIGSSFNDGGPYTVDDNTVLLLHFEGDLINQSPLAGDGVMPENGIICSSNSPSNIGQCLKLDGSSYITIPHHANLNLAEDWSIEAWIKLEEYRDYPNDPHIIRKPGDTEKYESNYALMIVEAWGNVFHGFYFPSASGDRLGVIDIAPDLNKWYHVEFTREVANSLTKLTVRDENWQVLSSSQMSFSDNNVLLNSQDIRIGENFNGYIDELRIRSYGAITEASKVNSKNKLFSIYPNPAKDLVYIDLPGEVVLTIYSLTGQKIVEKENFTSSNIDVSEFKNGIYIVMFKSENEFETRKLIIE